MCDDLNNAIEIQEQLGADTTKGAMMLMKAAAKSISKVSKAMNEHIKESDTKLNALSADVRKLTEAFEAYKLDATRYQLIVEICKALFGTTKRSVMTLVYFGIIVGLVHMQDLIELLKALI